MSSSPDDVIFSNRAERAFYRWAVLVLRHRWGALAISLGFTFWAASFLPLLSIDNSTEGFLPQDDPATISYNEFRDQFGRDDFIVVGLAPDDVFAPEFLAKLRELHLALEDELPYTEDITSLFNARSTRGEGDELIVEDLLEGWLEAWPEDHSGLEGLRERVLANSLYINNLVSADASFTTITIEPFTYSTLSASPADELAGFDDEAGASASALALNDDFLSAAENDALIAALREVVERFDSEDFPIHLGGPLVITDYLNRNMERDMGVFMALSLGVIVLLLGVLFRRVTGTVLPPIVVGLSVVATVGIMVALGIPGTTAVQILPVFILTVGICDAVHILTITYQRLGQGDSKHEAIAYAVGHSGLAVVMTSVTTAAGMISFISAEMVPIRHLGIIAPIGVMLALAYTLVMLPAVLSLFPLKAPRRREQDRAGGRLLRVLLRVGDLAADHPKRVLAGAAVVVAISLVGASQVRFSHMALAWFDEGDPMRTASELIDEKLRGFVTLEVVIDSGRENGLHDPELLRRIDASMRWAEAFNQGELYVGKALSVVDVVKETHQALNENRPEFHAIPDDRQLVAQELLLFENAGAEDMATLVDTELRKARLSLRAPFVDAMLYGPFIEEVERGLRPILGDDVEIELTGFMPVLGGVVSAMIVSMGRSYTIALLIITPLMVLLLRDVRLGLLSMIPNLIPVIVVLGVMGWLSMPLDATTIMLGAMVLGLAVDDTIHFMHKFRIYFLESGDSRQAIRETLSTTGAALLFTSLVLAGGFFTLGFARMVNTHNFGILAGVACLVAFAADVLVAPALMTLAARRPAPQRDEPELGRIIDGRIIDGRMVEGQGELVHG